MKPDIFRRRPVDQHTVRQPRHQTVGIAAATSKRRPCSTLARHLARAFQKLAKVGDSARGSVLWAGLKSSARKWDLLEEKNSTTTTEKNMLRTKVGMAIGILLAGGAVAANYGVSVGSNGLNEYVATTKGIALMVGSPFQPATPIMNGTYDGCSGTADTAPSYLQETQDETMTFGLFQPCGANAVLVEFGITGHGLYERYRNSSAYIGGLGNHQPQFQSLSVGPQNSVVMLVATPENVSENEALIYNNELQLLDAVPGFLDKTGDLQEIVSVKTDPSSLFFYLCTSGGGGDVVTQYAWKTSANPLGHPQSVLPVPYVKVSQSYDPLVWNAFCL